MFELSQRVTRDAASLQSRAAVWLASMPRLPSPAIAAIASRLLVLAAGVAGTELLGRVPGWQGLDPTRLSTSFGPIGNALTAASVRLDSIHYLGIAGQGYKPAGDPSFFPFYPLLIHVVGWLVVSHVVAGLLISMASFGIALFMLHRLTSQHLGERAADATVLLLAFAPLSFFFSAIYTESLFLALTVGAFYLASRDRFVLACAAGACATITHIEGISIVPALAYMYWERRGRPFGFRHLLSWEATALLMPVVALSGVALYLHTIGDGWLALIDGGHAAGNSHTIAPVITSHSVYTRTIVGPPLTIWHALVAGLSGLSQLFQGNVPVVPSLGDVFDVGFQNLVYLIVLVISLAALVGAWRRLPRAYAIYAMCVLIMFTMSTVTVIPLRAFDRYMLPAFPLWMSTAGWLERQRLVPVTLRISTVLLVFYTLEFTRWAAG